MQEQTNCCVRFENSTFEYQVKQKKERERICEQVKKIKTIFIMIIINMWHVFSRVIFRKYNITCIFINSAII